MPDDDQLSAQRAQSLAGIDQRFAFLDARRRRLDKVGRSAQRFRSQLERNARTRGSFVEQQPDVAAAQHWTQTRAVHLLSELQQAGNSGAVERLDTEQ